MGENDRDVASAGQDTQPAAAPVTAEFVVAGVAFEHPIMNAAGTCKTLADVTALARSAASAVVVGSITRDARAGNSGEVYWSGPGGSLNALGLPNRGISYYREQLPAMVDAAHNHAKPLVVSVAGFAADEYADLARVAADAGADLIELNLACPNVWDGGQQKRIACFDPGQTEAICAAVEAALAAASRPAPPYGVKLSPFSDPEALGELAGLLARRSGVSGGPSFVTAINTFPNALVLDDRLRPVLDVGLAGLSGAALKPVGLGQVRQLRQLLPERMDIIGVAGVQNGRDVVDYLAAGARVVQSATAFWNRGEDPTVFGDILSDWIDAKDLAAAQAAAG
ncbi:MULTISPECIES: dihydroorotate dehydrogenase [unclassified Frankia]|uniref:dihydroorotate dehydrogenase n=1 Tax=unclassified Frankia TaxID=2632575 RepID=UPI0009786B4D|nr:MULTISPECIES: dihydroorotate dehydrogenase [unclassified Frankia]